MITIALDSSQISTFIKCDEKWNLAGRQHLVLAGVGTLPLDKGTVFHKLLELYYIERFHLNVYDSAQEALVKFSASREAQLLEKVDLDFIIKRYREYIVHYSQSDFTPLRVNGIPSIELGFSQVFYEDEYRQFILEGKIDLLTSYRDELSFVDHKTQGRAMSLYSYTPQFLTYAMVTNASKAVINIIRLHKELSKDTFLRVPVSFAQHQIEAWKQQVMRIFMKVYSAKLKSIELYGHEDSPVFERNYGECGGAFNSNPCQFTHLCELNPANKEMYENLKKFKYQERIWTPWSVEEI